MIARAPGKLVLSGAYAVLEGAPAIVAAVDRYVVADATRAAAFVTAEVAAAIAAGVIDGAPWFDASTLRTLASDGTSRKLGLGSSAAIVAASIAAHLGDRIAGEDALRAAVFPAALAAHRAAQPAGSGIDVAASVFGGILEAHLEDGDLRVAKHALPPGTIVEVFACPVSASTAELLGRVRALAERDRVTYRRYIDAATAGAQAALSARSVEALVAAISAQVQALAALGDAAGATIVTAEMIALAPMARREAAAFGPSGAGGGDIAIYVGAQESSAELRNAAARAGFDRLDLAIGCAGAGPATG